MFPSAVALRYTVEDKEFSLANDSNLYSAEYIGSGTFIIKKPKRNARKRRLSKLKGPKRGMRK